MTIPEDEAMTCAPLSSYHVGSMLTSAWRAAAKWTGRQDKLLAAYHDAIKRSRRSDRLPLRDFPIVRAMSSQRRCETHSDRVDSRFIITGGLSWYRSDFCL